LALEVSGQLVLDVVGVAVLGVGVVVGVDSHGGGYLSDGGGGVGKGSSDSGDCRGGKCSSEGDSRGQNSGGADDSGPSDGHYGSEDDELKIKAQLEIVITRPGRMRRIWEVPLYMGSYWTLVCTYVAVA
jgi:hypothetical protein